MHIFSSGFEYFVHLWYVGMPLDLQILLDRLKCLSALRHKYGSFQSFGSSGKNSMIFPNGSEFIKFVLSKLF